MQVATGSGETSDKPASAVETDASDGAVTPKRFYSVEAAAKHWAAPMGIVMRPGGYLHTTTPELYLELPEWLQCPKGGLAESIYRLWYVIRSVHGWAELGHILLVKNLIYTKLGPRGATQFYLRSDRDQHA